MNRSKWKGPYVSEQKTSNTLTLKRRVEITPKLFGKTVYSHNGKSLVKIEIVEAMVGHKIGEFASTRSAFSFKKKKK